MGRTVHLVQGRKGTVRVAGVQGLDDCIGGRSERVGDFGMRRRPAKRLAEAVALNRSTPARFLETAGHVHRPPLVAQDVSRLALDARGCVGGEADAVAGIEAVDGDDERNDSGLDEVLLRKPGVGVWPRDTPGKSSMAEDQRLPGGSVARLGERGKPPVAEVGERASRHETLRTAK